MDAPHLSLVIPAYNESHRLPATLQRSIEFLNQWGASWELVVVDDGSTDDTPGIVERMGESNPHVRLIRNEHGGKGSAVRTGMLGARGRWRFVADADQAMDLSDLTRFFEPPVDVAVGSREARGAKRIDEPAWRHVLGRIFNWYVRLLAVPGIHDTQCGYKLFSADAARTLFSISRLDGFAFDVEVLYLARRAGMTIREVPIVWRHRRGSRLHMRGGVAAFLQVLVIRWNDMLGRYDDPRREAPTKGS
jgi:glycosyltransferase involved in cell wall biosynthesis